MTQRLDALTIANRVRTAIADVKDEIGAMPRPEAAARAAEILRDHDHVTGSIRVEDLLLAIRHVGRAKADRLLRQSGLATMGRRRRVRDLTVRERTALADVLVRAVEPTPVRVRRDRRAQLVRMVDEGVPFEEIAEQLGYANAGSARRALSHHLAGRTA